MADTIDPPHPVEQAEIVVRDIKKGRPKKEGAQRDVIKKNKKPKPQELYWRLRDAVDHHPQCLLPEFPHLFRVYYSDKDTRLPILEDRNGVCRLTTPAHLASLVAEYLDQQLISSASDFWVFTKSNLKEFVDLWMAYAKPVEEPRAWTFKSSKERAFVRLPWDPQDGPTPTWDGLLSRMSSPESFMAYFGSLFVDASDRQQYLWLYGEGNDGKGSIFRFLQGCFGNVYSTEQLQGSITNQFWTWGILHKRVVVFPDCNNYEFVTSGLFKSLTGGDPIRIEPKGGQPFTATICAKFIFGSNEKPKISGETSDMRRLIYSELKSWDGGSDPSFEKRLWTEGGAFIYKCLEAYHRAAPGHQTITVDQEDLALLASHSEEDLASACEHFYFSQTATCSSTEFYNSVRWKLPDRRIGALKKYLSRVHAVTKRRVTLHGGERCEVYVGIRPKVLVDSPDRGTKI